MRLDFNSFIITGPSTVTTSYAKALNGQIAADGMEINPATSCATDIFTITNAPNLPELCGTLSGEHGNGQTCFCQMSRMSHFGELPDPSTAI